MMQNLCAVLVQRIASIRPALRRAALAPALVLLAGSGTAPAPDQNGLTAVKCAALTGAVPGGTIASATWLEQSTEHPAHCELQLRLASEPDSRIKAKLLLPASWNGRLLGIGNHGLGGYIPEEDMQRSLARGFAVFGSDTGHTGQILDASWMTAGGPALKDFGWRATHTATVAAKSLVTRAYGRAARHAYFKGCSTGGRMAMREAQEFPDDFDGVIVGSAPFDWTGILAHQLWAARQVLSDGKATPGWIAPDRYPAITAAALAQCDARNGVRDGFVIDPRRCAATVSYPRCTRDRSGDCLTAAQAQAIEATYRPLRNPRTGAFLFDGLEPTGEAGWVSRLGPHSAPPAHALSYFAALFGSSTWDWRNFDFARDLAHARRLDRAGAQIDSLETDLTPFMKSGGKIIQYHGWLDPAMSPRFYPRFYQSVADATTAGSLDRLAIFYRLFMVPGLEHCFGGPGPNSFGGLRQAAPPKIDAQHDVLSALVAWVEERKAPDRIIATRYQPGQPQQIARQMPLCPFPQAARWTGRGDRNDAASFTCATPTAARSAPR